MSDFLIALLCFIFLFTVYCVWFYLVFICFEVLQCFCVSDANN